MVFKLSQNRSPSEKKLKSLEWAIVTQLNGKKSVKQIGDTLALNPEETHAMFKHLMDEGLLELVKGGEENHRIPAEIFEKIEYQFTHYVGPVANILIDDVLAELKRNRLNLERQYLPILIELISLEISNKEKRYNFQ
ncbi:MAG: hypothetical protein GWN01_06865, partial [Nitrosopumilaceae archaeon]|nr:hypothetical protein [Nitrosopumilaceae archaeon]NIX61257.1 hypothetical protein [Nitrosopumilaceae archaeon]